MKTKAEHLRTFWRGYASDRAGELLMEELGITCLASLAHFTLSYGRSKWDYKTGVRSYDNNDPVHLMFHFRWEQLDVVRKVFAQSHLGTMEKTAGFSPGWGERAHTGKAEQKRKEGPFLTETWEWKRDPSKYSYQTDTVEFVFYHRVPIGYKVSETCSVQEVIILPPARASEPTKQLQLVCTKEK